MSSPSKCNFSWKAVRTASILVRVAEVTTTRIAIRRLRLTGLKDRSVAGGCPNLTLWTAMEASSGERLGAQIRLE
eukprot:CAMPEP_0206464176 /NCGR_PEP_ID=MMETSP0324_2-20121206/27059_1 /ASSEMBLY_ACC=CAM_ASM_000836 /TAXON_ID=2866 /ORGANISM="Crypthecodinium cohnii, Strain Seligo" /LENGTH=74 /DNA_ID=CAMNT_0053936755 /DNA_START=463 /DNA_END=684 /DNA_ORIENTATION=+